MIKLYWFIIATCFLCQLTLNHGLSDWYFKNSSKGCISCFRYITKIYYADLDTVSPNCSPAKYSDLKNVIRYAQSNYFGFNVCFNVYEDMFKERFQQMQQQVDKVLKDFIKCFEKTGLKDEDKKKLDDSIQKFQADRDICQKTDPPMGTVYLKTENNDMIQTFHDDYQKIPKEPAKPDPKATSQSQSKSPDTKKDLPPPASSDTSNDSKSTTTDKSTVQAKPPQPSDENFPQNAPADPSQAMKSGDRSSSGSGTSSSMHWPVPQGSPTSQDNSFQSQQSRVSGTQSSGNPSNGADDYWRSNDGPAGLNSFSMGNQGPGSNNWNIPSGQGRQPQLS